MTAAEMIEVLAALPPETPVVVNAGCGVMVSAAAEVEQHPQREGHGLRVVMVSAGGIVWW